MYHDAENIQKFELSICISFLLKLLSIEAVGPDSQFIVNDGSNLVLEIMSCRLSAG